MNNLSSRAEYSRPLLFVRKHLFSFLLTALMIMLIYLKLDIKSMIEYLSKIPLYTIACLFLVTLAVYCLRIFRWRRIILKISKANYLQLFPIFFSGGLINQLTPGSKSGGQPIRAYYLTKLNHKKYADNLATTLFEFISGSFTSLMLLAFAFVYLSIRFPPKVYYSIMVFSSVAIITLSSALYLAYRIAKKSPKKILSLLYKIKAIHKRYKTLKYFEHSMLRQIREFFSETIIFFRYKRLIFEQMGIELLAYLLEFLNIYILFIVMGVHVSFASIAVITIIAEIIGFIFFSPGGVGVVEGTMIGLYYVSGIDPHVAAAVAIITRAILYFYEFFVGYVSLIYIRNKYR